VIDMLKKLSLDNKFINQI